MATLSWSAFELSRPGPLQEDTTIFIESGSSVAAISSALHKRNVLRHPLLFRIWARMTGHHRNLKAGEYQFSAHITPMEIAHLLKSGKTILHKITIPEGLTSKEIVEILNTEKKLQNYEGPIPQDGSLLPETYYFSKNDEASTIIERMKVAMKSTVNELWQTNPFPAQISSPQQVIILASIIEKETSIDSERTHIAGVFINRLRKGMRLQSDPTVAYAINQGPLDRPLTRKDLRTAKGLHNTYLYKGLPPSPICNPGRASLKAVMQPMETDHYYFVADGTGGHVFARTLKEHNKNVQKWRKIRRAQQ